VYKIKTTVRTCCYRSAEKLKNRHFFLLKTQIKRIFHFPSRIISTSQVSRRWEDILSTALFSYLLYVVFSAQPNLRTKARNLYHWAYVWSLMWTMHLLFHMGYTDSSCVPLYLIFVLIPSVYTVNNFSSLQWRTICML